MTTNRGGGKKQKKRLPGPVEQDTNPRPRGVAEPLLESYLQRIAIVLRQGMFECARAIIKEAETEFLSDTPELCLDTPLADTDIAKNIRVLNHLEDRGIMTVGQLLNTDRSRLSEITGMGESSMLQVMEFALAAKKQFDEQARKRRALDL